MNKINLKPNLLLHACCAPCLTSVYEQLKSDYVLTVFWFNPNIDTEDEYNKRLNEVKRFCDLKKIDLIVGDKYKEDNLNWHFLSRGLENEKEGGKRCAKCIRYRLLSTGMFAEEREFDFFTTTLSVSPHKNAGLINELGGEAGQKVKSKYLSADFKKNDGYLKSIQTCRELNIYRQSYCGCEYSRSK